MLFWFWATVCLMCQSCPWQLNIDKNAHLDTPTAQFLRERLAPCKNLLHLIMPPFVERKEFMDMEEMLKTHRPPPVVVCRLHCVVFPSSVNAWSVLAASSTWQCQEGHSCRGRTKSRGSSEGRGRSCEQSDINTICTVVFSI